MSFLLGTDKGALDATVGRTAGTGLLEQDATPGVMEGAGAAAGLGVYRGISRGASVAANVATPALRPIAQSFDDIFGTKADEFLVEEQAKANRSLIDSKIDPRTTGFVSQLLYNVGDVLTTVASTGGNPFAAGGVYGITQAGLGIMDEGLDTTTAVMKGTVEGVGMGVGVALPAALAGSLAYRLGTGAALNVGQGVATRAGVATVLNTRGYAEQAKQYEAFGVTDMLIDGVLGATFGGFMGKTADDLVPKPADGKYYKPEAAGVKLNPVSAFATADDLIGFARTRLSTLIAKRDGTPDETIIGEDGKKVNVKGEQAQFLTPEEKAEIAFLEGNIDNAETLASAYNIGLVNPSDVDAALVRQTQAHTELGTAPGIPVDAVSRNAHVTAVDLAREQTLRGEDVEVSRVADRAAFVREDAPPEVMAAVREVESAPELASVMRELADTQAMARARGLDAEDAPLYSRGDAPSKEKVDAYMNGMLTLDEFLPEVFPAVDSKEVTVGPSRFTPKPIKGAAFFRETNSEGLFDILAYDKQFNATRMFVATNKDIAIGQGDNQGVMVEFRSRSISGDENKKPGTNDRTGREFITEVIAPRSVTSIVMNAKSEKGLRPLIRRVLNSDFTREIQEDGMIRYERKVPLGDQKYSRTESTPLRPDQSTIEIDGIQRSTVNSNGKQIAQTEEGIRNFWKWFADSKVVDAEGRPLVVYHGTRNEFDTFDYGRIGQQGRAEGAGFYFTTNKDVASGYGNPMEVYLSITKPMGYDQKGFSAAVLQKIVKRVAELESSAEGMEIGDGFLSNFGDVYSDGLNSVVKEAARLIATDETAVDQLSGIVGSGVNPEFVNAAVTEVTGYDGVVSDGFSNLGSDNENKIFVALTNTQIKSATGNNGQFDPANPDIRMSRGQSAGSTVPDLTARFQAEFGRDASRLTDYARVEFVQSVADLPGGPHPSDVRGMFWQGRSYIVADNVPPDSIKGLILHEIGTHAGMNSMLGADLYASVMNQIDARIADGDAVFMKAREIAEQRANRPEHIREETLAYLVEAAPELPFVRRILAQVRQWLYRQTGGRFVNLNADDMAAMAVASLRVYARQAEADAGGGVPMYQITPSQARDLKIETKMPADPLFAEAVGNTSGASVTDEGLLIDLVRYQKPEQEGAQAIRTGVFYLPTGSAAAKHYKTGKTGYGGTEKHQGETLLRAPLFVRGATGGKAPEVAYDQLKGKKAYENMRSDVLRVALGYGKTGQQKVDGVATVLEQYGADPSLAYEIVRNSKEGNTLPYAVQENIVAHAVREAGYDSVVGYSKGKAGASISEVFDVREQTFPARGMDSDVHEAFLSREADLQSIRDAANQPLGTALDDNPDMRIPDDSGNIRSAVDLAADAADEIQRMTELSKGFEAAITCAFRFGT